MKILKGPLYRESVHLCVLKCVQQFATYNAISLAADSMGGHIVCCSVNNAFFLQKQYHFFLRNLTR